MDQRLTEDMEVTISLEPDGRTRLRDFNAIVIARVKSGVIMEPVDVDLALVPPRADQVFVSFVVGAGLVALKGTVTREHYGLRFEIQDGVRVKGRRYTRVDAELPVLLQRAGAGERGEGTTVNVAQEGLLARADLAVTLDEVLTVALSLPGAERPLELCARVVRHSRGLIALHLQDDGLAAQAAIAEFVVEERMDERRSGVSSEPARRRRGFS